ncbi:early nodulin-like protein 19 [Musa acuminata AAA Group]|uniref:early nodulin-like protein 19 n=1 Tax=Musa acuminata AAA Group TaxID=214697 RepID=UPI0031D54CC8
MAGMQRQEKLRGGAVAALPFLLLLIMVSHQLVSADRFSVGDSKGWNPNVNYTVWVEKHKPFHVGDWLVFYYQSGMADVVQVDEAGYNKCDASNPISNYSKGRSYAFELNHTGRYYFICSRGYCYGGMRLAIAVEHLPPPSPPPSSLKDSSAAAPCRLLALTASLLAAALFPFHL